MSQLVPRSMRTIFIKPRSATIRDLELELRLVEGVLKKLREEASRVKRISVDEMTERMMELARNEYIYSRRPRSGLQDIYRDYVRRHNTNVSMLHHRISGYTSRRLEIIDKLKKNISLQ